MCKSFFRNSLEYGEVAGLWPYFTWTLGERVLINLYIEQLNYPLFSSAVHKANRKEVLSDIMKLFNYYVTQLVANTGNYVKVKVNLSL